MGRRRNDNASLRGSSTPIAACSTGELSLRGKGATMPQGSKAKYSSKQKRKARHIEESYEKRGASSKEAARRAWATVNKESGGGKKSGSGRGKKENRSASHKGGRKGGSRSKGGRRTTSRSRSRSRS